MAKTETLEQRQARLRAYAKDRRAEKIAEPKKLQDGSWQPPVFYEWWTVQRPGFEPLEVFTCPRLTVAEIERLFYPGCVVVGQS